MGQGSRPENSENFALIEDQIRECYGRVVYSHKTHEKCADILLVRNSKIKLAQIALSAATTVSLVVVIFGYGRTATIVGALVSIILLALNVYTKDFDLVKDAQRHKETADKLWMIRETYISLLVDMASNSISLEEIKTKRDKLQEELSQIYKSSPRTNLKGYSTAQKALKESEDMTFSDEELDNMLLKSLRKTDRGTSESL